MLSNFVAFLWAFAVAGSLASQDVVVQHVVAENANIVEMFRTMTSQMTALTSKVQEMGDIVRRQEKVIARHEATIQAQSRDIRRLEQHGVANSTIKRGLGDTSPQARNVVTKFAFSAYLNHDVTGMKGNQSIVFDSTLLNEGNAYNPQDGTFTAQVGGVYLFSFVVNTYKDLPLWVKLVVNGNTMAHVVIWPHYNPSANMQGSNLVLLRIQSGDRVWVAIEQEDYGTDVHGGDNVRATTFSGVFLYE